MTSSTTGDRSRWGTTRRSGMTILGKVAVPKPINLPSQRLENQGLDPNVEIVPKGTLSWGSKSSLNAWGTSSLSPRTESGPGSPSHLSNRPSSGGSVTRPSTADSDKAHDSSSIAWDSNSRPSSASGVFPSNQASVALQRPHSADTRPGSSQLSRFAEAMSETSATWGQHGVPPTKNDGFSLTSGDFPSLGAEKESSEKSTRPQDAGPHARPASSSGRSMEERGVDCPEGSYFQTSFSFVEANVRIGDANTWKRDNQPYSEDAPRHYREEGQLDSRGSQFHPTANFPHQYDAWRGPPVNNHQGGGWNRENHPYGAPMVPGGFHMEPYPNYPTQVPPGPGHGAGPRGNDHTNGKMFRPPMLDSYVHPRMQTRPEFYLGPVPHEGYYGPPMGYGSPSNRDVPFAGRPVAPHAYNKHSGQGGYDTSGNSVALEQNKPSHSQETQRPYKVLLNPQSGRFGEDEATRKEFLGNRLPNPEKVAQQMQTSKNNSRENSNEASGEVQPIKAENATPEDPSLIQKIEGLNAKTRTIDGWQNASSVINRDQQESNTRAVNSGNSVSKVSTILPRTGHASDGYAELAAISGTAISSRRSNHQAQGRADYQTKQRVNSEGNDGWRKTILMSGSSPATSAANSEHFAEVNVGDSLATDYIRKPGSGISVDPNDNERATMRELARQRAQQRQKEEEERARDQRAKALAKLEELNRRSQVAGEGSVKNSEAASNASIPEIPEDPRSLSPALPASKPDDVHVRSSNASVPEMPENPRCLSPALPASKPDDVHVRSSLEKKTTVAAAKPLESTGESIETSMQDRKTSTEFANNVGPTQQDNLPRDRDGAAAKQKRLGYKQKQNILFEKKMAGNSFSAAATEVCDVVPSPEVSSEGVLSYDSDMPAMSSVSTESTFTKRKNNRNGKKKHKIEETTTINPTRVAVGKETKSGDESIETGSARVAEKVLGSVSVPRLDIKVSGNSSEQISSFTNEESQSKAKSNWKSQHLRRTQRNSLVNKPAEKFPGSNAVIWAPIHPQQKVDISTGGSQNTDPEFSTSSKSLHQGQTSSKTKRVEIERYVAKPIVKEMAEQTVSKKLIPGAREMTENVLQKENCGGEGTGTLQPSGSTAGKSGSPSKSRHGNARQGKHGREHGSWHQRGSAASTKALEEGQFVTSNQPTRGTVNYHTSNHTEQIAVGSAKDQTTSNDDGWNDGWHMTPETHYSAAEEMEASVPQAGVVGKDQGMSFHGKQHAFRNNKGGGSNYGDLKKANKRDFSKAHMQPSGHGLGQPDLPVASKESRGSGDHVSHSAGGPPNINKTGKYGGREKTRDKTYVSHERGFVGHEPQGFTSEQKKTSADTPAQSQNRSTTKEVQVEQNPSSMFQKNTGQSRRFGRGQESQGGWGSSVQENMHHHHHQRPHSNRDRQKQNMHYEYKPVGSHTYDREHNREQMKDSSQTESLRYREKGQGHQRHGGQKLYQQQRGIAGRNTGPGLTDDRY
ncbi:protein MODIFIER OF SNC1 1 isoform X2 [Eutrema salsugineum]|uniref:protein MODIFIER OF SNC1 1 isoform X2 n=1 Tax=Eutrema salsugineum TaxID=72664 RepID=UPI000CED346F|nr:protein MODIFIER OF SNC1 1 isoform X2 [Eutrema salsugineum]